MVRGGSGASHTRCVKRRKALLDLHDKTALVAGMGAVGVATADRLSAPANVVPLRRAGEAPPDLDLGWLHLAAQLRLLTATVESLVDEFRQNSSRGL